MEFKPARNDAARLRFFRIAVRRAAAFRKAKTKHMSDEFFQEIAAFPTGYASVLRDHDRAQAGRAMAVAARNKAVELLSLEVRTAWTILRLRLKKGLFNTKMLAGYGVPEIAETNGRRPDQFWIDKASELLVGDAETQAANGRPLSEPSGPELRLAMETAKKAMIRAEEATEAFRQQSLRTQERRKQADTLQRELYREFRYFLARMDTTQARRIMRSYGLRFSGEAAPEEEHRQDTVVPVTPEPDPPEAAATAETKDAAPTLPLRAPTTSTGNPVVFASLEGQGP